MSTTATANLSFVPQSPSHWVPDDKRSSCKSCHKDFTFFNRRHQSAQRHHRTLLSCRAHCD